MILLGDDLIPFESLINIKTFGDIETSKANSTLVFSYDENILKYCFEQNISSAIIVSNIKEAIYANALNAKYIIVSKELSSAIQKVAENYMFDSKILVIIESNDELEEIASKEIDGVIYNKILA